MGASIAVTANSMGTLKKYIAIFPFSATILVGSVLCGVVYSRSLSCACFVKLNIDHFSNSGGQLKVCSCNFVGSILQMLARRQRRQAKRLRKFCGYGQK